MNQVTEIIAHYKDACEMEPVALTVIISIMVSVICISLYAYSFMKEFIRIFEEMKR